MVAIGAPFLGRQFSPRLGGGGHGDRGGVVLADANGGDGGRGDFAILALPVA